LPWILVTRQQPVKDSAQEPHAQRFPSRSWRTHRLLTTSSSMRLLLTMKSHLKRSYFETVQQIQNVTAAILNNSEENCFRKCFDSWWQRWNSYTRRLLQFRIGFNVGLPVSTVLLFTKTRFCNIPFAFSIRRHTEIHLNILCTDDMII
jgi:hypothetical protein